MKKLTKILGVAMALAMGVSTFAFAACGPTPEPEHQHTYATEWSKNDSKHWHESTCEHKGLKSGEANHDKNGTNGSCSVCGYAPHVHTYSEDWTYNDTDHWHAATCGHATLTKDKAAHDGKGADGGCSICEWKPAHEHSFNSRWSVNTTKHWHAAKCAHTEEKSEEGNHTPGEDGKCTVCGWIAHEDTYVYAWGATKHWQQIECSLKKDGFESCEEDLNETAHKYKNFADHTYDANGSCTVCGYNPRPTNYNDDCILCEVCGGCIKADCVHSTEANHKYCKDTHGEDAKTYEIEAEDAELFNADGSTPSILDYKDGYRCCVHPDYGNVKFTITVNKECTVTLRACTGKRNEQFAKLATVFVNGVEFETKAFLAQPSAESNSKTNFSWNTLGCIKLNAGPNEIEIDQYQGGWNIHFDKIALITASDVTITYEKVDNSAITERKVMYVYNDEDKDISKEALAQKKYSA